MKRLIIAFTILCLCSLSLQAEEVKADSLGRGLGVWSNPSMLLRGKLSGVAVSASDGNPAGAVNIHIRGLNSVRGVSEPLWIVDGAILSSSTGQTFQAFNQYDDYAFVSEISQMEGWNIYDIESIEVLKNASATALFGARGANGVIIVKTRMPSSEQLSREFHTNVGLAVPAVTGDGIRPGIFHSHSLAVGSTSGRTRYRLSAFYRDYQGVVKRNDNRAIGLRAMFDTHANKVVWFGLNTSLSISDADSRTGSAWYGAPSQMLTLRGIAPFAYNDVSGVTSLNGWAKDYDDESRIFRTTDNFYLTINFTRSLKWNNSLSFDMQDNTRYIWYGNGTAFGKDVNGAAGINYASLFTLDYKSELSWQRWFGKHHLELLAVAEYCADWNKFNVMSGTNFFMHDLRARGLNLNESKTQIRYFPRSLASKGGHAQIQYAFGTRAGFDIAGKYETVNRYDSGSPFEDNFYPSANIWVNALLNLRIEGGYGVAGRRRYVPYGMLPMFTGGNFPVVAVDYQAFYEGYNRITTSEWNVGVSGSFLKDRLSASLAYYDRRTDDNLTLYCFGEQHPRKEGVWRKAPRSEVMDQGSLISNKGVEFDLSYAGGRKGGFAWKIGVNGAYNINELLEVGPADVRGYLLNTYGMYATKNEEGHSVSSIYGFTLDGSNTVTGEGLLGDTVPRFTGGMNISLSFKGISLDADCYAAAGFKILNLNRMLASGEEYVSAAFVENGDYLRLGKLTIGYDVPLKIKWLSSLNVHLTGTNLLTLTGYQGWNPDVNSFSFTNLANGLDYGSYPVVRSLMLGASVKF